MGQKERLNPFAGTGLAEVKAEVRKAWDLARSTRRRNQAGLGKALGGLSQSAVSKLLNDDNGHPWTKNHLALFAQYIGTDPSKIIPSKYVGVFGDWGGLTAPRDQAILEACIEMVRQFYTDNGQGISEPSAKSLANQVYRAIEPIKNPSSQQVKAAVVRVILSAASS